MAPIHPSVIRHFGLKWANADSRYLSVDGASYTFAENARRYMRYEWNRDLSEGMTLASTKPHEAVQMLRRGLVLTPDSARGHFFLALALKRMGQVEEYENHTREALRLDPIDGAYHHELALILAQQNQNEEALHHANLALQHNYANPHSQIRVTHLLAKLGRFAEAKQAALLAVRLEPKNVSFRRVLIDVLARTGELEEALEQIRITVNLGPPDAKIHSAAADILTQIGEFQQAREAARQAIDLRPDVPHYWSQLTLALVRNNEVHEAIELANSVGERGLQFVGYYIYVSHLFTQKGQIDAAILAVSRAIHFKGTEPEPYAHLSRLHLHAGNVAAAEAAARAAVALQPDMSALHENLGEILARMQRTDEARTEFETAIELEPGRASALDALRRVSTKQAEREPVQSVGQVEETATANIGPASQSATAHSQPVHVANAGTPPPSSATSPYTQSRSRFDWLFKRLFGSLQFRRG
jgi:Flp pilus assembly protein TadD